MKFGDDPWGSLVPQYEFVKGHFSISPVTVHSNIIKQKPNDTKLRDTVILTIGFIRDRLQISILILSELICFYSP